MKFLLIVYICSGISGECFIAPQYPKILDDHHDCVRAGLSDSHEIIYSEKNFTKDQINNSQLYPKFTCTPEEII